MRNEFPVAVCAVGAIIDFLVWMKLRVLKVRERSPASRVRLSLEQRQKRVRIAGWILFGSGWVFLAGAALLLWLGNLR